jgi:hypothetical protein
MSSPHPDGVAARAYSVHTLVRIATPVLEALGEGKLKARMPLEFIPTAKDRHLYSYLEALGRLLAGIAPWFELGPEESEEGRLRERLTGLATKGIAQAVDPLAPDFMNFSEGAQPLVDAAFLAHALLRAPTQLWGNLEAETKERLVACLQETRRVQPGQSNWLLFSAIIEAMLWKLTGTGETKAIETAVTAHLEWYVGDGTYGDGPELHWDYYNSFVIQPMLLEVLRVCVEKGHALAEHYPLTLERARRYAAVQEMLISPEGTFPIVGRSATYRFGAFQLLAQMALEHRLPENLAPGAVRAGLTAVIRRMIEAPGTFDENGWLRLGVVGHQPASAEPYISTGSLYLCAAGLVHLGLLADDPFWTEPDAAWTQKRIWAGENVPGDHALHR